MTLPAFAAPEDLANRIPNGITAGDEPRAQAALDDASALIRAEAGKTWCTDGELDDDVPDIVVTITLKSAQRAFTNPDGQTQEQTGQWMASYANASPDVYLTERERTLVRRAAGRSGVWVQPTTRGPENDVPRDRCFDDARRVPPDESVYVDVDGGEPVAWLPAQDDDH